MRIFIFLLSITVVHAADITGRVVGVSDGDTITILTTAKESVKIRLHGIDAPEAKQAFGSRAKQEFSNKPITLERMPDRAGTTGNILAQQELIV